LALMLLCLQNDLSRLVEEDEEIVGLALLVIK
jgi:hypothetical protein